ncbi:MAG: polysaccharide pyruvyl transferase family protein [Fibrobacter sp.]|nr:polysaccharide pyruvyl transferase family protein [Fibrobacter sp.]
MRIAIVTIPPRLNFGGILQAYALQHVLERMGHRITIIDKPLKRQLPLKIRYLAYIKRFVLKFFLRKSILIFEEKHFNESYPIVSQYIQPFIDRYLHTQCISNLQEIKEHDFEAYVVGSDQIWRRSYNRNIQNSYLSFTKEWNVKRVAYAASFGIDEWDYTPSETQVCSKLLKKFDFIGIREKSGVHLCKKHLQCDAKYVLDPTLLLEKEDYLQLINNECGKEFEGKILCYLLDDNNEKRKFIEKISQDLQKQPLFINAQWNTNAPTESRIQPSVERWLGAFYHADYIVTDSFHGTVFSLIFNKKFLSISNQARGTSRLHSLLSIFDLESRIVFDYNNYEIAQQAIDYTKYNKLKMESLMELCNIFAKSKEESP